MVELILRAPAALVEPVSDALMDELEALSVSVEDADADTDAEQALFGEPGMPAPAAGWERSTLKVLFDTEAQADAAVAVGGASAMAGRAADAVLLRTDLAALPDLMEQARRTRRVMRQNLFWAAAYNALAVPMALMGWLPPWAAGLGMALSSAVVVLNGLRLAR
jgi:ribosomal protein L11 methylase PrmA